MNYMVLTAHFIDSDWKLHKKILNFCLIDNHKGDTIGEMVEKCLEDWGIKKVMTMTVNCGSSNDGVIAYLIERLNSGLVLNGEYLHVKCFTNTFNLVVCDILGDHHESVAKIRSAVHFVRCTPGRFSKFEVCMQEENISCKNVVCLDVPTSWGSTYLMLEAAVECEKAFERLKDEKPAYLEVGPPSGNDWENARLLVKFLEVFYDTALGISGSLHITSNMVFHEISTIQDCMKSIALNRANFLPSDMAEKMKAKFDNYWGNNEKENYLMYLAVLLDPRYKMKFLRFCFNDMFESYVAEEVGKRVEHILRCLMHEYSLSSLKNQSTAEREKDKVLKTKIYRLAHSFREAENKSVSWESEIELYFLEPLVWCEDPFDILSWWKENRHRYRVLSQVACDILAIPFSTVASESAYSTGGYAINSFNSSLDPTTMEALLCCQSWLKSVPNDIDLRKYLDEISEMEEVFKGGLEEEEEDTDMEET